MNSINNIQYFKDFVFFCKYRDHLICKMYYATKRT